MKHIETVKRLYTALNRNDISAIMEMFDSQIERFEFIGTPLAGTFRGLSDVEAHFKKGRENWAEGACQPEQLIDIYDKVVVFVHVRVRLKDKAEWNEGRVADVYTFKRDKIIEMRSFLNQQDALAWAKA